MYYLYVDESGDEGDYNENSGESSRYFTLAGIIVDEAGRYNFKVALDAILSRYFKGVQLPPNFKLHYHDLRQGIWPYSLLQQRYAISNEIFSAIKSLDCALISVTLDLDNHCRKYSKPANPRAYTLLLLLERFQYFLEDKNTKGEALYEMYNSRLRKKVELVQKHLLDNENFPKPTALSNVSRRVKFGDPTKEPILQFADFFAYVPWIRSTTDYNAENRWNEIKHKYYNFDHLLQFKRGNLEI